LTRTTEKKREIIPEKNFKLGITLALVAFIFSALTTIVVKFAALTTNKLGFIAVSYIYNTIFAFTLRKKLQTKRASPKHKNAIIIGFLIGLFNFVGFYAVLNAHSLGPLSLVAPTIGLSFVIAIILSAIIYKEKLTMRRITGILLAIVAAILLGM